MNRISNAINSFKNTIRVDKIFKGNDVIYEKSKSIQTAWIDSGLATWTSAYHVSVYYKSESKTIPQVDNADTLNSCMQMFYDNQNITFCPSFDTSNVTGTTFMFMECRNLVSIDYMNFKNVGGRIADSIQMYKNCVKLKYINVEGFGTNYSFSDFFYNCQSLETVDGYIDNNFSTNNTNMFLGCSSLKNIKLRNLNTSTDLSPCVKLSGESIEYLLKNAKLYSSGSRTLSLSKQAVNNSGKDFTSEFALLSANGWTVKLI